MPRSSPANCPPEGSVLGIDVGYSDRRRSTCFCLLSWTPEFAALEFRLTTADVAERLEAIVSLTQGRGLAGVAIDGPLGPALRQLAHYRSAESILSRGILQKRGKPGATTAPVGRQLHDHAIRLAEMVLRLAHVEPATHREAIDSRRIVEAFPNAYLAAMVEDGCFPALRRNASDVFWHLLVHGTGRLQAHLAELLPGRKLARDISTISDHDERAGMVCALTALTAVRGNQVAVGDPIGGDIMLPARSGWGMGSAGRTSWLEPVLRLNVAAVRGARDAHISHLDARILEANTPWRDT